MMFRALALIGITLAELPASAQKFEVVSIRPNPVSDIAHRSTGQSGGRIRFIGMPLSTIIMPAYQVWNFQLIGGPSWIWTDGWDIIAQAEDIRGFIPMEQLRPMLRAMLEDRFQLKTHKATRKLPGYRLVVDKHGSKLRPSTAAKVFTGSNKNTLNAKKVPIKWFAAFLGQKLGGTVVDDTGLTGEYDIFLKWAPEATLPLSSDVPSNSNDPSLFTALREQLGLRLISHAVPTDVLVIDSVQRPSPN